MALASQGFHPSPSGADACSNLQNALEVETVQAQSSTEFLAYMSYMSLLDVNNLLFRMASCVQGLGLQVPK